MMSVVHQAAVVNVDPEWEWPLLPHADVYVSYRTEMHSLYGLGNPYRTRVLILISLAKTAEEKVARLRQAVDGFAHNGFKGVFFIIAFEDCDAIREAFTQKEVKRVYCNPDKDVIRKAVATLTVPDHA